MATQGSSSAIHRDRVAQRGYTQIENVVLFNGALSLGARVLYAAMKHFVWRCNGELPPQLKIAEALGVSERAMKTYVGELRDAGLLTTQRRMAKASLYVIEQPQIDDSPSGEICPNEGADFAPTIGQNLPEKEKQTKNLKKENSYEFSSVVAHWLEQAPPLVAHKEEPLLADRATRKLVERALADHGTDDVLKAISNYATMLGSDDYWLDQKWSMHLFFKQRNAFPNFLPEADPLGSANYRNRASTSRRRPGDLTFEQILNGGSLPKREARALSQAARSWGRG